jgi:hypothetical protein
MAPVSISLLLAKTALLKHWKDPDWVDGGPGQPGRPRLSKAMTLFLASTLVRDLASRVGDRALTGEVRGIGKRMAEKASGGLIAGWEDGDDWFCGTPPHKWPKKWPPPPPPWDRVVAVFDPVPEPWFELVAEAVLDKVIASALEQIASLTPDEQFAGQLKGMAAKVGGQG